MPITRDADLRILSPQPDTSLPCQTIDTSLVHRAVCLLTSPLLLVLIALVRLLTEKWPN